MWDQRYSEAGFAYGTEPNDFLSAQAGRLRPGSRVLCIAEGEGRNAVFLAGLGHRVTAMDQSAVGLAKARELAAARGVHLDTAQGDLSDYDPGPGWDAIVSIWGHLPPSIRAGAHGRLAAALNPGGLFLLEAYTPEQLELGTGGPRSADMLYTPELLAEDLAGLVFDHVWTGRREIHEGRYHQGWSATVQVVARKPSGER